jgi:hypothetical protein
MNAFIYLSLMIIEEPLPHNLNLVLNSPEFDNEAGILIKSTQFTSNDLYISFDLILDQDTEPQSWQVKTIGVKEEKIVSGWTQHICIYKNHPLLLGYADDYAELYFTGSTLQWQELFIDIVQSLIKFFGTERDYFKYILSPDTVNKLSQQGYGLFARGPRSIMELYQSCLIKHGINAYFIGEIKASISDKSLKLLQIGSSHVVGHRFYFERI